MITNPATLHINHNVKRALLKGTLLGGVSILAYIIVVIMTSPELPTSFAINAAFSINPIIIYGTAFGVGVNTFISSYSKGMGCRVDKKRKGIFGVSSGSTALSAFFSFFSLVPSGCCGPFIFAYDIWKCTVCIFNPIFKAIILYRSYNGSRVCRN